MKTIFKPLKMNSIKSLIIGLGIFINITQSFTQSTIKEDKVMVSLGYGFGHNMDNYDKYADSRNVNFIGPTYGKIEFAPLDNFTIGLNFAFSSLDAKSRYEDRYFSSENKHVTTVKTTKWRTFSAIIRANWYIGNSNRVHPYLGLGIGYRHANKNTFAVHSDSGFNEIHEDNQEYLNNDLTYSDLPIPPAIFGMDATLGVKIDIINNLGVYTEFGIAKSVMQFGITAKF